MSVLTATSKNCDIVQTMRRLVPLLAICGALVTLSSYLIIRSITRLHYQDWHIADIKRKYGTIPGIIDGSATVVQSDEIFFS